MPSPPLEILLVEDSDSFARAVGVTLRDAPGGPMNVTRFSRISEAVEYLQEAKPDCAIVDLTLPDAQGVEAVRALRAQAPELPLVVLSGLDDEQLAFDAVHEGAQDYLVKGRTDADVIVRSIRYAIERARGERQRVALLHEQAARAEAEAMAATIGQLERFTEAALSHLSLDDLLAELLEHVCEMLEADTVAILLLDEERQVLTMTAAKGLESLVEDGVVVPVGAGFAGRVFAEKRTIAVEDTSEIEIISPVMREKVKSVLGVPLTADGRTIGVIHVGTTEQRPFSAEESVLLQLAGDRAARAIARARAFQHEHQTAVTLQRALLPDRLPDIPGAALAARYLPGAQGAEVGGDWYDVIPLTDGRMGLAMGDVVGRGVPAASLMGQLRNALRAYAVEGHTPATVLERLDRLVQALSPGRMATLLYMVLEPDGRSGCYANAGHLPPMIIAPGRPPTLLEELRGVPLGVLPYASFDEAEVRFEPGSTLVLYTDGLVEVRGVSLEIRLNEMCELAAEPYDGPNELCERLIEKLLPEGPGSDDVAVLALTTAEASTDRLSLTLSAQPEALVAARRALRNWLTESGADAEELYDITLAVGEACTNAIEHAYSPGEASFDLEAINADGDITIVVRDYGKWRAPRGTNRGRGLKLMETLMDEVDVQREEGGTTVAMRRRLGVAGA